MKKITKFILFFTITILLSSCAHLIKLDTAQRNFSEGATIENTARFSSQPLPLSSDIYYRLAYAGVKESLKKKSKLDQDGLLGNAYTLQALCEWKLGKNANASSSAKTALSYLTQRSSPNSLLSRDAAIMKSMDALIQLETVYEAVFDSLKQKEVIGLANCQQFFGNYLWSNAADNPGKLQQSFNAIDKVLKQVPEKHEVRNYLIMAELTGVKSWSDALHYLNNNRKKMEGEDRDKMKDFHAQEMAVFKDKRKAMLKQLEFLLPEGKEASVYKYWHFLLGG